MINAPKKLTEDKMAAGWDEINSCITQMVFDFVVYCFFKENNAELYNALTSDNAKCWGAHHLNSNYSQYDPVVKAGQGENIFIWNTANEADRVVRKIMNERRDYGMRSGVTIPLRKNSGQLVGWISLSCNESDKYLNTILNNENFIDKVKDIHIRAISKTLSAHSDIDFETLYAITLADYCSDINLISDRTGASIQELRKLYSNLYLINPLFLLNISISGKDVKFLKNIVDPEFDSKTFIRKLSSRQQECILFISKGLTAKQAAKKMGISPRTYEEYVLNIRRIFNASNQKELICKLHKEGLL